MILVRKLQIKFKTNTCQSKTRPCYWIVTEPIDNRNTMQDFSLMTASK